MPVCASARLACRSHGEEMAFARRARGRLSARAAAGSDAQHAAQRYIYTLAGEKGHTIAFGLPCLQVFSPPPPLALCGPTRKCSTFKKDKIQKPKEVQI